MQKFRIPTKVIQGIAELVKTKDTKEDFVFTSMGGNQLVAKRLQGIGDHGIPYDTWEFEYNPED